MSTKGIQKFGIIAKVFRKRTTLAELLEKYIELRQNVKLSTRISFEYLQRKISSEGLLQMDAADIRVSDAKQFFVNLQRKGYSFSEIRSIYSLLKLSLQLAVDDGLLYMNPINFSISSIVRNDATHRDAYTRAQRDAFLEFCKRDNHFCRYYEVFYILFHTGIRISEFCGLCAEDIDLENSIIHIRRQLLRLRREYVVEDTKTLSGTRDLPIEKGVAECFAKLLNKTNELDYFSASSELSLVPRSEAISFKNYLTHTVLGKPTCASNWEHRMKSALEKYNSMHEERLPHLTPHICRHTYCTLMAEQGISPKVLQYLMGHSDIKVTMNVYTHIKLDAVKNELISSNIQACLIPLSDVVWKSL